MGHISTSELTLPSCHTFPPVQRTTLGTWGTSQTFSSQGATSVSSAFFSKGPPFWAPPSLRRPTFFSQELPSPFPRADSNLRGFLAPRVRAFTSLGQRPGPPFNWLPLEPSTTRYFHLPLNFLGGPTGTARTVFRGAGVPPFPLCAERLSRPFTLLWLNSSRAFSSAKGFPPPLSWGQTPLSFAQAASSLRLPRLFGGPPLRAGKALRHPSVSPRDTWRVQYQLLLSHAGCTPQNPLV